jgi:peptidoglycan/xylan/chitin deacetylase (PgdA/CDA1 family)
MERIGLLNPVTASPGLVTALRGRVDHGALVISLDFELLWGVRDKYPADGGRYRANLLGARKAVPRMLGLFAEYGVNASWAVVGFLFANGRADLERFRPDDLPRYDDPRLSPFDDLVGDSEDDDPLHFAPGLVRSIRDCPGQEIASHTYSHYYCLEPGQTRAAFRADIASAVRIAEQHGVTPRSIVFPRNQFNPFYTDLLREAGIVAYRSNESGWIYNYHDPRYGGGRLQRAFRKADAYLPLSGANLTGWDDLRDEHGLCDVPSSRFLRPYSPRLRHLEPLRLRRITRDLRAAAERSKVFHLWWHPHNFGLHLQENLNFLRAILDVFAECRHEHGMKSLTMAGVAEVVARG